MVTNVLEPQVMVNELESLPELIETQLPIFRQNIEKSLNGIDVQSLRKIYLVGSGDSYHAALASELLFEHLTGIDCEAVNGLRFLEYSSKYIPSHSIVIGISASGRSTRVVDSVIASKEKCLTMAITGDPESSLAQNAHHLLNVSIPFMGRSPGIRTYIANLLGLILTGFHLGNGKVDTNIERPSEYEHRLSMLPGQISAAITYARPMAKKYAQNIKDAPAIIFLGSGPSFGTAMFSAAKVCEACGVLSFGQDLEEFAHVENLCYPDNLPVCVIAPRGTSHWRAVEISKLALALGKRVVVVAENGDDDFSGFTGEVIPVPDDVCEEYSPFLYEIFGTYLAAFLAEELGRKLFRSDLRGKRPLMDSNIQINCGNPG